MKTLVIKDIKVIGILLNLILIVVGLIFVSSISLVEDNDKYLIFCIYIVIVLFMVGIIYEGIKHSDRMSKIHIILNSLPINRSTIVGSRYITVMIYTMYSSIIVAFSSYRFESLLSIIDVYPIGFFEICNIIGATILINSIFLPLDFYAERKDQNNRVFLLMIICLTIIAFISFKTRNILYEIIHSINPNRFPYELMIICLIAYLVSLYFSIKIYKTREL